MGLAAVLLPFISAAQSSSLDCPERTATSATLILPEKLTVREGQTPLSPPFVLVVVNSNGACAGAVTWTGAATSLTVWGRPAAPLPSPAAQGPLAPGDSLRMRLYDPQKSHRLQDARPAAFSLRDSTSHLQTSPVYVPNGLYVVDQIHVRAPLASDVTQKP